jgi:hypothetical protein
MAAATPATARRARAASATCALPAPLLLLLLLLAALLPREATAHPYLFRGANCTSHPSTALGRHEPPRPDPSTTFELRSARGAVVTGACPGVTYTLTVSFFGAGTALANATEARKMLLTATAGKLGNSTVECPGREATGEMAPRLRTTWALPCVDRSAAVASGAASVVPLELRVTSASGAYGAYWQTRATVPLRLGCVSGACSGARARVAVAPPPPGGRRR